MGGRPPAGNLAEVERQVLLGRTLMKYETEILQRNSW